MGLHTAWRRAQDREQWQRTIEAIVVKFELYELYFWLELYEL